MNDLHNIDSCGTAITYADDKVIVYKDKDWCKLKVEVDKDLKRYKQYFDYKLSLNISKTKFITFNHISVA